MQITRWSPFWIYKSGLVLDYNLNDFGVFLYVFKPTGIISDAYVAIWKFKMAPFFKMAAILYKNGRDFIWPIWMILVSFCEFWGCWHQFLWLGSPWTCHFLKKCCNCCTLMWIRLFHCAIVVLTIAVWYSEHILNSSLLSFRTSL